MSLFADGTSTSGEGVEEAAAAAIALGPAKECTDCYGRLLKRPWCYPPPRM